MIKIVILYTILMATLVYGQSNAQSNFSDLVTNFPEYSLPLDPQLLLKQSSNRLSIEAYNQFFFNFKDEDPYIILDDGEKALADLAIQVDSEPIEYAPGKFDEIKVIILGRLNLHPDYYSLIFAISNMEFDNVYMYNFDNSGVICSGLSLTVKDNLSSTYRASLKYYSLIKENATIVSRDFVETAVLNTSFCVRADGVFEMLTWEEDVDYYDSNDWGINKKLAEINLFEETGTPTVKNN